MNEIELRRQQPILTIGTVRQLTGLTERQIRYYIDKGLLQVTRTKGNQRRFSLDQVDELLEIKQQLNAGFSLSEAQRFLQVKRSPKAVVDDQQARRILFDEMLNNSPFGQSTK